MLLGSLGAIPRAKIAELVNPDPETPMSPNHRVQASTFSAW